jgi:hypothetical protein
VLAKDLTSRLDPVTFAGQRLYIPPDPWQTQVLRSSSDRILMNCCRQSGKSTVAAILALHAALYHQRQTILLLSPSMNQSKELFRKVLAGYRFLGRPVQAEAENQMSLALENGSRVISLPGNESTIRGYSRVNLLIIDEAAQVSDDLYAYARPFLAVSNGRLLALSTPFGQSGWWAAAWHNDTVGDRWERYKITADECPRITSDFLKEEQAAMGDWKFQQEYMCDFMQDEFSLFREDDIAAMLHPEVKPWRL